MKKYFVVSDVHGFYDKLMAALNQAGFDKNNPEHIFVSCGDLFDRGDQPFQCLDFVLSLPADRKILVRGNHEDLLEQLIERDLPAWYDFSNGTLKTALQFAGIPVSSVTEDMAYLAPAACRVLRDPNTEIHKKLFAYLASCKNFGEAGRYVFVHGWMPKSVVETQSFDIDSEKCRWEAARWDNGMEKFCSDRQALENKTVICGHFRASFGNTYYKPYLIDGYRVPEDTSEEEKTQLPEGNLKDRGNEIPIPEENMKRQRNEIPIPEEDFYSETDFHPFQARIESKKAELLAIDACTAYSQQVNCITICS